MSLNKKIVLAAIGIVVALYILPPFTRIASLLLRINSGKTETAAESYSDKLSATQTEDLAKRLCTQFPGERVCKAFQTGEEDIIASEVLDCFAPANASKGELSQLGSLALCGTPEVVRFKEMASEMKLRKIDLSGDPKIAAWAGKVRPAHMAGILRAADMLILSQEPKLAAKLQDTLQEDYGTNIDEVRAFIGKMQAEDPESFAQAAGIAVGLYNAGYTFSTLFSENSLAHIAKECEGAKGAEYAPVRCLRLAKISE